MTTSRQHYKVGQYVTVVDESFGWAKVKRGMTGIITALATNLPFGYTDGYEVMFGVQAGWTCTDKDIKPANPAEQQNAIRELRNGPANVTVGSSTFAAMQGAGIALSDLTKLSTDIKSMAQYTLIDPYTGRPMGAAPAPKPPRIRMPTHLKGAKLGTQVRVTNGDDYFDLGDIFEIRDLDHPHKRVRGYSRKYGDNYWIAYDDITTDLEGGPGKVSFDSVILPDHKKAKIMATIKQVDNYDLIFNQWGFGAVLEKGKAVSMLFYGPPGTGKTLMAQAIADKYNKKLKFIGSAEIESSEPGQAERNIKAFFEGTDANTILLFDECDSLVYSREQVGSILAAQVNQLLSSLETFEGIVVFTTNRLGQLDEAFNRRLSLKVEFAMPSAAERVKIWQRMFPKKAPLADDINWQELAEVELSGGYIKNVVLRAARMAAAEENVKTKDKKIAMRHLVDALTDEAQSVIEFEEAASHNHTPRLRGGGVQRSMGRNVTMGTGSST